MSFLTLPLLGSGRAVSGGVLRSWSDEWWRASSPADDIWHGGNLVSGL